ncbi:Peptidase [Vibrio chagasii]|uniref:ricin-type beta-trefoil lectin domain protein n=1 Tax=Vibrio chagasii TaxID=170679 RepID=UPI001EFCCB43|nr:ricin-type beta-trefoil lectin domain protein [Vibrio chagasii]MDE9380468.1 ricin-type beta-trefoil lectin domain protein [Vibrio alginolyticus]MCG9604247.1 ricin-type beta-trefoil lectin domain protein [Vibrio chagasii]CAH7284086.1 Peptidase [Vibrio chagasii]CAH7311083.1 Peptidase [Vibrio chagasii]CAH7355401.1 Peptidase [Vibrio chagasii]
MKTIVTLLSAILPYAAVASDSQVTEFMEAFHESPQTVMDAIPEKTGQVIFSKNSEYMSRHRDLMRDTIMRRGEANSEISEFLLSPIRQNDNPARLVDAGNGLIRNLNQLAQVAPNQTRLDAQPWSDTYWPLYSGALAWRYADKELRANNWQDYFNFSHSQKPLEYYQGKDRDDLSPAEKYDLLVGDENFTLTQRSWESGKGYYESRGHVERWMGLCHGWAPAAYMLPRPKQSLIVPDANGEPLTFYPSDIKALGTLLWSEAPFSSRFIGGRCNIKDPERDENGRVVDPNCVDTNPASWHLSIINQLGISKRSLIMDATYDYQVWNQPVVGYKVTYFNPQTNQTASQPAAVTIDLSDYRKDRFSSYRSSNAQSVVGVQMVVSYVVETSPTHRTSDSPRYDGITNVTYYYDLELDQNGNAIGGEWYQNRHPDFLWTPTPESIAKSYYDGQGLWDITQPVPQSWQDNARRASRSTQPLTSVVEALFEASSGTQTAGEWRSIVTESEDGLKCLDAEVDGSKSGLVIYGWRCHDGDNQKWKMNANGKLINKAAPTMCLDQNGIDISLELCRNHETQQWRWDNGQLKNGLANSLKWNDRTWRVGADINGSQWRWK